MALIIRIILLVLFLSSHSFGAYYPIPLPGANGNVLTSNGSKWTSASASASNPTQSYEISNLGLATSVAASALTIALKQSDGSTDPSTGTSSVKVGMRSSTLTSGLYNQRSATSATSLVISSGSTLGQTSAVEATIYVYLLDNSGTLELAASGSAFNENAVVSTTAEGGAGAADSASVLYSTTARSNVPFRLVGKIVNTQTTAGTWASAGTSLHISDFGSLLPGVTSSSTGLERVERARLQITSASACTVVSESGDWLGTCTASSSDATIPINSGIFSGAPSCSGVGQGSANAFVRYGGTMPTSTSLSITHRDTSNAASTAQFDIICMGPR